jgi:hypothetical protein
MAKRASKCAIQIFFAAALVAATGAPVSAQHFQPIFYAYDQLVRPWKYLQGRASPYFDRKTDFFGGIDAAKVTTNVWMGVTYAPFGTLAEDGWRARFKGSAGFFSYKNSMLPGGINEANAFSAEVLGGYRKTFSGVFGQTLYVGAFAGFEYEDQILALDDPSNPARGSEAGIKGSIEIYSRLWERYIATAFASASTVHNKYHAKAQVFYELTEMWALGGEIATLGDARYDEYRAGLAGALTWQKKIITLSAGFLDNSGRGQGGYLTLSVYSPF